MSAVQVELGMLRHAKQRGAIWVQFDTPEPHEILATLISWHDKRCRVEFLNGAQRTIETSRVRPAR